jgi:hypothetical protein
MPSSGPASRARVTGSVLSAINFNLNTDSTVASVLHVTATGNFIGNTGVNASGSETADGIQVTGNGPGTINALISGIDIRQYTNPYGIHVFSRDGDGFVNATITGNTVAEPSSAGFVFDGIRVEAGSVTGDGSTICTDIGSATAGLRNKITLAGNEAGGGVDLRIRIRIDERMTFPGYVGGATDDAALQTYLAGRNNLTTVLATNASSAPTPYGSGASCPQPST